MSAWREALAECPEFGDIANWPLIEVNRLVPEKRAGFIRNRRMVCDVLNGHKLSDVANDYQCTPASITKLLNRCFTLNKGTYSLTSALIPYQRLKEPERKAPLPTLKNKAGTASALRGLFEQVPNLKKGLDELIIARLNDKPTVGPVSPATFHGRFQFLLREAHWPHDHYPYTTQDCAYESLRRYLCQRTDELAFERDQKRNQQQAYGLARKLHHPRALDRIQIDSHDTDFRGRLNILLNDQLIPLPLARADVYVARDVATDANLGYTFVYSEKPNRWDVLKLIAHCTQPWVPLDLTTPGLAYEPGAYLPSGLPERPTITFNSLELDNAWVHHARVFEHLLCGQHGTTLGLGKPKSPKVRNWVEHAFDTINRHVSHRLPSTTGSSVTDPKRESRKNQRKVPLLTWRMFEEAIDIELTAHNLRPQGGRLGGACPLDLFREQVTHHWTPYVPQVLQSSLKPFELSEVVPVKSRTDSLARHINLDRVSYPCRTLTKLTVHDHHVEIRYDWRDLRVLDVYSLQGQFLGQVFAPMSWQSYPHSKATRSFINSLIRKNQLRSPDLLAGTLHWLMQHSDQASQARNLLRLYGEFESGNALYIQPNSESLDHEIAAMEPIDDKIFSTQSKNHYTWSSKEAPHERDRKKH